MIYGIKSGTSERLRTIFAIELEAGLIGLVVGAVASGSVQSTWPAPIDGETQEAVPAFYTCNFTAQGVRLKP